MIPGALPPHKEEAPPRRMLHYTRSAEWKDRAKRMGAIRFCIRIVFIMSVTLALLLCRLAVWPTVLVSERLDRRLRRGILMLWARCFRWLLGVRLQVRGTPPAPPFILVANHLSYIDMLLLNSITGCIFVARGDVEQWPVIGQIAKCLYIIFIDRERKRDTVRVNRLIQHALEQGDGMAVFAESRISRGRSVEPLKSALIEPAVQLDLPVYYATLHYETRPGMPPANRVVGWWRPEPFFKHLGRLFCQPGFTATIYFGAEPLRGSDRKTLARDLHKAVLAHFTPMK